VAVSDAAIRAAVQAVAEAHLARRRIEHEHVDVGVPFGRRSGRPPGVGHGDLRSGGGQVVDGFAVIPAWRPDGQRLAWTSAQDGQAVHMIEATPTGDASRTVGASLDRELAYGSTTTAVLTGQYRGASWLFTIDLGTGARTPLTQGSQPSVAR